MARFKKNQYIPPQAPLLYEDHGRPVTRRQFIRQGLMTGSASVLSAGAFSMFANPNMARAAVAPDLDALATDIGCILGGVGAGQSVPFISFDLAGGANFAGSNVLVGQGGGQMDLLSTAGYSKLGLPGDMLPGQDDTGVTLLNTSNGDFTNSDLNLMFHADSPMLLGILEKASAAIGNIDGAVIPARSDNDTGNNPHNPLYPLAMAGARGSVVDLIGSRSSVSGGNSMAPAMYIDPNFQPTKVDRPSDVTGLVDVGDLTTILGPDDVTAVMESITRITHKKLQLGTIDTGLTNDDVVKDLVRCGYLKASDIADRFAGVEVDPTLDTNIAGPIFSAAELANDGEFRKTASVMKMVMNGYAAGGCITMGGYDYHTGDRIVGENRDLRAGRCIGACLEYARLLASPLMIYVFSDGSVASNGRIDDTAAPGGGTDGNGNVTVGGGGKGEWTGDNSSTACSFFLVFDPTAAPTLVGTRQIGRMTAGASVVTSATPAANNVNLLVNMVMLNYMALNGQVSPGNTTAFTNIFPNHGLGNQANLDSFISFGSLV
ncbi:MAG: general secretion pathway protein GspF [Gammaproteobacteria bacterium]|nr:general secretion pathway protein GspF [Gammaproteobacteria bacterium]